MAITNPTGILPLETMEIRNDSFLSSGAGTLFTSTTLTCREMDVKDDLELENQALTALTMNNLVPLSNTGGANNLANRHHSSAQGANNAAGQGTLFYAKKSGI